MKYFKVFLLLFLALLAGIGVGVGRMVSLEQSQVFKRNGSWWYSKAITSGADPVITAQVTTFGLFALPPEEAVYLFARKDENNELLNGVNDYIIEGNINDFKAKYWSLTAYGKDLFLIPNEQERYSFNSSNLVTDSAGNFKIHISQSPHKGNWLPVGIGKPFYLLLRFYKSDNEFIEELDAASLPLIRKIDAI
jgi:hypothetical protein